MKALIATAALVMAVVALFTTAMADPAFQGASLQLAGWTLPGSALDPGAVSKERNYSVPVQADPCECSGERGCIPEAQCKDAGGRCLRKC